MTSGKVCERINLTILSEQQALQQGQVVSQVPWQQNYEGQMDECVVSENESKLYSLYYSIPLPTQTCVCKTTMITRLKTNKQIVKDTVVPQETVHLLLTQESKSAPEDVQ